MKLANHGRPHPGNTELGLYGLGYNLPYSEIQSRLRISDRTIPIQSNIQEPIRIL